MADWVDRINEVRCIRSISSEKWDAKKWNRQLGTLGGGNHFIEVARDDKDDAYLLVHSGSRNLGNAVARHYQKLAVGQMHSPDDFHEKRAALIERLRSEGKCDQIEVEIGKLRQSCRTRACDIPDDLCYLTGQLAEDYLHDMRICQEFAVKNRKLISEAAAGFCSDVRAVCDTAHNYIDDTGMVRKGAVSAKNGELFIIPVNMRDGSLLCVGRGNEDWNYSAPHGAGRLMSRRKARESLSVKTFTDEMRGIFSTTVCEKTIDEAPEAYKSIENILDNIEPTAVVIGRLYSVYNFKAVE